MLARQFQALVTEDDLASIEAALLARGDVQFLSSSTNEGRNALLPLRSLRVAATPAGPRRRTCFLAPKAWSPLVEIEPLSDVKVHVRVEASEIIEFSRSYCADGEIQANRVYYTPRRNDEDGEHDKDVRFVRWAEQVVRTVKKVLRYDANVRAQVGPDAASRIASGELRLIR